jgi:hypothetical protein
LFHVRGIIVLSAEQDQHDGVWSWLSFADRFLGVRNIALVSPLFGLARVIGLAQPRTGYDRVTAQLAASTFLLAIDRTTRMENVNLHNSTTLVTAAAENFMTLSFLQFAGRSASVGFQQIFHR